DRLYTGDAVDFFRVLEVEEPRHLHLLAEMRLPGEASLEFSLIPLKDGQTELRQLSRFLPKGLFGLLYWYVLYPFHQWIFREMLKGVAGAVRKPVVHGPDRFAPGRHYVCRFEERGGRR
ncbi:MAG: DUF2867 domain-containing protein, partial [Deltaproteobacteria bacterium]|nr:DUF2867 domain-containing protein [Deltaproteobacteria bacterium]